MLSVKDNGRGIPEVGTGVGLGLTFARRVVVATGGTLTLKSQLGVATELVIRMPTAASLEEAG